MLTQQKALLNLVRFNYLDDSKTKCKSWHKEDHRRIPIRELLTRLEASGLYLDKIRFIGMAHQYGSPEAFAEDFIDLHNQNSFEPFFLAIFELWRRLLPNHQTISIFCDELDQRIYSYDKGMLSNDELIQNALAHLEELLDEHVDTGAHPEKLFEYVCSFCAHDIESFLYDYIYELIEDGNKVYASELIDSFYPYISDVKWFDFLRIKLFAATDVLEVNVILKNILKDIEKSNDIAFYLTLLRFMVKIGDRSLFIELVRKTLRLINKNQELEVLLLIVLHFYRCIDQEDIERKTQRYISFLSKKRKNDPLDKNNKMYLELISYLTPSGY